MRRAIIRYQGQTHNVTVGNDLCVQLPDGSLLPETAIEWLPPARGSLFALGLNYAERAVALDFTPPSEPLVFVKTANSFIGHRQQTWRPEHVNLMHFECELVAVICKPARRIRRQHALEYLAGYTVCNDYAVRDYLENYYRPNLRVKNRDASTPLGPWIVDVADVPDPSNLMLRTWVNGKLCQQGTTADMIFDIPTLVEYLSSFMTLQPGDMIASGTPQGMNDVQPGDEVITEVDKVGRLINFIASERDFFGSDIQNRHPPEGDKP